MKQLNSIAIITARGGSKRIPKKNIKKFLGTPIIKYVIDAALKSECFDIVMVSTDDIEIANYALSCGASVPFLRSKACSDDFATTADVLTEVIKSKNAVGIEFKSFCCIYPTAVFMDASTLKSAMQLLEEKQADAVVPVTRFSYPIHRSLQIKEGVLEFNWPEYRSVRSQDLPVSYHDVGLFYALKTDLFLHTKQIFTSNTRPMVLPEYSVQDIDTEEDWITAEMKYSILQQSKIHLNV